MAFHTEYLSLPGLTAGADLSAAQYKIVKLASTAGTVVLAATSTVAVTCGVLMNAPLSGEAADVAIAGVAKVKIGTSVMTVGAALGVNTTSYAVLTTTDNRFIIGRAAAAGSAIGDIIPVVLVPGGVRY